MFKSSCQESHFKKIMLMNFCVCKLQCSGQYHYRHDKNHDRIRYHWHCNFEILKRRKTYKSCSKRKTKSQHNGTCVKNNDSCILMDYKYYLPMIFTLHLHSPFVSVISLYQKFNTSVKRSLANMFSFLWIFSLWFLVIRSSWSSWWEISQGRSLSRQ
jgi:hypothetical protein